MPVIRFTELSLENLKADKQTRFFDSALANFGVICGKRRKTFFVVTGEERKLKTLGRFPSVTLKSARREALAILDGTSVIQDAQDPDARIKEYIRQLNASARYKYEQDRLLRKHLLPKATDLNKVGKADILKITDRLVGTPSEQLHAHRAIRAFYNWCVLRDYAKTSPLATLEAPGSDKTRDVVLTPGQFKEAWQKSMQLGSYGHIVRLCMLLATRKGETSRIEENWVNDNLVLPPYVTKNGREHVLPLSDAARQHALSFSRGNKPNWNSWNKIKNAAGLQWLRLHDIRRTHATMCAELGIPIHIIERILNHVTGEATPLHRRYNRHRYLPEMKAALQTYEKHLEAVLGEPLN
jgi:integrase